MTSTMRNGEVVPDAVPAHLEEVDLSAVGPAEGLTEREREKKEREREEAEERAGLPDDPEALKSMVIDARRNLREVQGILDRTRDHSRDSAVMLRSYERETRNLGELVAERNAMLLRAQAGVLALAADLGGIGAVLGFQPLGSGNGSTSNGAKRT